MRQVCFRAVVMVLASVLAHAASPAFAHANDDEDRQPALTRPIADFLEKQGQHLTKGIVPEFLSFTAYFDGRDESGGLDRLCRAGRESH